MFVSKSECGGLELDSYKVPDEASSQIDQYNDILKEYNELVRLSKEKESQDFVDNGSTDTESSKEIVYKAIQLYLSDKNGDRDVVDEVAAFLLEMKE